MEFTTKIGAIVVVSAELVGVDVDETDVVPGDSPPEFTICVTYWFIESLLETELNTYGEVVPWSKLIALNTNEPGL